MKEYSNSRIMFHATHRDNVRNIFDIGVSPDFATRKRKAIWFVPKVGIQSAILHTANRHSWRIDEIHVITIAVQSDHIKYSGNGVMFYSQHSAIAESHAEAVVFLDETGDD